jgi:hypothetical protein
MARYLLSAHTVEGKPREPMSDEQMQEFMRGISALEDEMNSTGTLLFSGRLHDPSTATVVRVSNGEVLTSDGPFAEAKEHLGGFYIIEANDLDEALSWAQRTSECVHTAIEVRPFWDDPRG